MLRTITVSLSDTLYEKLKRASELSHQPAESIIIQSLTHSLPPLLEDIPEQYQPDVYPLLQMGDVELQREADRTFPADHWTEYKALLDKKKTTSLTAEEQTRLDILRCEADVLTFRRGYAAVLLKR